MPDAAALIGDPQWLPHDYDAQQDRVQFVRLPRAARGALAFLADHRPDAGEAVWLPVEPLRQADLPMGALGFLFHSAFCRSTLLAKAFEAPGLATGLSEPAILNRLAHLRAMPRAQALLAPVLALLSRPMAPGEAVVVKPSNIANPLIPALMQAAPEARAVLLSGGVEAFLHSVARKGLGGRLWVRRLYAHNEGWRRLDVGLDARATFELTDLQVAGLAWLQHRAQFADLLGGPLASRLATLAMEDVGAGRADTLLGCARFWGIALTPARAAGIAQGPVFARHAKLGTDFAATMEAQTRESPGAVTEEEIGVVAKWIGAIAAQMRPSIVAARPLPAA